jgi:DNA replication initiation complex subunit (GINS family)
MANEDINLTYETLFELLRREKNRVELQALEPSFYKDFINYLKTKKDLLLEKQANATDHGELTKLIIQIDNINKIMKELFERREKKIVTSALFNAKSGQTLGRDALLDNESKFYAELIVLLKKYRMGVLDNLLNGDLPNIELIDTSNLSEIDHNVDKESNVKKETLLLRIQSFVPKFVGEQLENYGPYESDEIVTLPYKMAKILIDNDKAEEINED